MTDKTFAGRMSLALVLMINVCLGTVYSWSVFRTPVEQVFNAGSVASGFPYMIMLAVFSMTVPFAGRFQPRFGPRKTAIFGGIVLGLGWTLSAIAPHVAILTLTWGVLGGIGVGTTYVVPLAIAHEWFPLRRGVATGVALAGFGMSPFVTAPLAELAILNFGLRNTFWIVGVAFAVLIPGMSAALRMPNDRTASTTPVARATETTSAEPTHDAHHGLTPRTMVRTREFYALWIALLLGSLVGLGAIAITAPWAQEVVGLSSTTAAVAVSFLAVFNGIGRPVFGYLTDRIGLRATSLLAFTLIGAASGVLLVGPQTSIALFLTAFAIFWLLLGGWLAIAPAATAALFGPTYYAQNYGIVFQAYGLGAVLGTLYSGELHNVFGSYRAVLIPILVAAGIGLVVTLVGFRPKR